MAAGCPVLCARRVVAPDGDMTTPTHATHPRTATLTPYTWQSSGALAGFVPSAVQKKITWIALDRFLIF